MASAARHALLARPSAAARTKARAARKALIPARGLLSAAPSLKTHSPRTRPTPQNTVAAELASRGRENQIDREGKRVLSARYRPVTGIPPVAAVLSSQPAAARS